MNRSKLSAKQVGKSGEEAVNHHDQMVANVNKIKTRSSSVKTGENSKAIEIGIKRKSEVVSPSTSEKTKLDLKRKKTPEKARRSAKISKGRAEFSPMKQGSLAIQEKYKNASLPKIMVRGKQAFIEGRETPMNLVETDFNEGDQILKLTVDAEYSFAESESDEGEMIESEDESDGLPTPQSDENELDPHLTIKDTEAKMQEIDDEMSTKIMELHEYMKKSGLKKSIHMLEKCFKPGQGESHKFNRRQSTGNIISKKLKDIRLSLEPNQEKLCSKNTNHNHAPPESNLTRSKSMETIYRNAIDKRMSSSSEECIDISDENLNIDMFADEFQNQKMDDYVDSGDVSGGGRIA